MLGVALLPSVRANGNGQGDGLKPHQMPAAFLSIAADGTTTILCNRLDMGQGVETSLAMICCEELDGDWSRVRTGFGNQSPAFVDPVAGMHLTGGSNAVKNSFSQYRELGARTRAMLLAAAAQAWKVPVSSLTAANGVVSGGGRRAGYGELFAAAMQHPVPPEVTLKDPARFTLLGKPTGLKAAAAKSSGRQAYGMDVQLPGMLTAVVLRPPVFGGKPLKVDDTAARQVPGVKAVLRVPLDRGEGVAVIASGYWAAQQGRNALQVEWDTATVDKVDSGRLLEQFRTLAASPGKPAPQPHLRADLTPLAKAPRKLVAELVFPYLNHAQMEPLACTVDLRADRCTIHTASQMPGIDAAAAARLTGLPAEKVDIVVQMGGGGFGRRGAPTAEYVREATAVAVALAKKGQAAPVKVVWSREDDMRAGWYRPFTLHRAEIGFDDDGRILAWDHRIVSQSIGSGTPFEAYVVKDGVDALSTEGMREPYRVPMQLSVHHPQLNVPVLWWRSVGSTHTAYAMETLIDEVAVATKQDPVAYRLKLMDGHPKASRHRAALQLAVDKSGYGRRTLPAGHAWGVAVHESFDSVVAYVVEARMEGKGAERRLVLVRVTAGVHCNFCVNPRTVEAQVQGSVMMALATTMPGHAITLKDGVVEQGNFHQYTVPRMPDAPRMDVHIVPSQDPPTGMGEPALPPLAPALANAVARLTGERQRSLPFHFA
nr:molybdopterin cofactor-binding domain-containing protein [Variovorax sp. MHTC-1]